MGCGMHSEQSFDTAFSKITCNPLTRISDKIMFLYQWCLLLTAAHPLSACSSAHHTPLLLWPLQSPVWLLALGVLQNLCNELLTPWWRPTATRERFCFLGSPSDPLLCLLFSLSVFNTKAIFKNEGSSEWFNKFWIKCKPNCALHLIQTDGRHVCIF